MVNFSADEKVKCVFFVFFLILTQKTGFEISAISENVCIKCLIEFSVKNKKSISNLSSAGLARKAITVNYTEIFEHCTICCQIAAKLFFFSWHLQ